MLFFGEVNLIRLIFQDKTIKIVLTFVRINLKSNIAIRSLIYFLVKLKIHIFLKTSLPYSILESKITKVFSNK